MFSWPDVRRALSVSDVCCPAVEANCVWFVLVLQAKEVAEQTVGSQLDSFELVQFKAALR